MDSPVQLVNSAFLITDSKTQRGQNSSEAILLFFYPLKVWKLQLCTAVTKLTNLNIKDERLLSLNVSNLPLLDQLIERLLDFHTKWFDFGININCSQTKKKCLFFSCPKAENLDYYSLKSFQPWCPNFSIVPFSMIIAVYYHNGSC